MTLRARLAVLACASWPALAAAADPAVPPRPFAAPSAAELAPAPAAGLAQVTLSLLLVLAAVFAAGWLLRRARGLQRTSTAAGLAVAFNLEAISRFVEKLFGFKILPGDVYYLSELPSQVNFGDVGIIVLGTVLLCFLSNIYPSWRASRLDPAEALRYD